MRGWRTASTAIVLLFLLATALPAAGRRGADRSVGAQHRVLIDNEDQIRFEFVFPRPKLRRAGGWSVASIDGVQQIWRHGELHLPEYSVVLAVPHGTEPRLELTELRTERLPGAFSPATVDVTLEPTDVALRAARADEVQRSAARQRVVLEPLGIARDLQLARVNVYPVHPNDGWDALRTLSVTVWFDPIEARNSVTDSGPASSNEILANSVVNRAAIPAATIPTTSPSSTTVGSSIPEPRPSTMTPLKIRIREAGLYVVTYGDLLSAGVDPTGIDPSSFVVTRRGIEIAIDLAGGADGTFDPGDTIRFYGRALGGAESWDNVYRLTGGSGAGLRMTETDATPDAADPVPTEFDNVAFRETDILYYASVPESSPTPWLWESLAITSPGIPVFTDQQFMLSNVSSSGGTGRLEVRVQSRREVPGPSPNHRVRIYLNGNLVDEQSWTGLQSVTLGGDVPQNWIQEGSNIVRIENPSDLGLSVQTEYTDWIRLSYLDGYRAEGDYLEFGAEDGGPWNFRVDGFSGSDVRLYDVADPDMPVRLVAADVGPPACIDCTVSFSHQPLSSPARLVAVREGAERTPYGFQIDAPSNLRTVAPSGADLLIVAYDDFVDALAPLAALRQSQGLRVVTATLTDVYDEFNGGIAESQGIKNFVQWAFENYATPAPLYLLLVGDATFDPKDHKGNGDNYVPARTFYASGFGHVPSDTWYAAVAGPDEIPDLAVGRIGARTVAEVETYVDNLLSSEDFPNVAALNSGLLYVTDDDDTQFQATTESLISLFHPPAMEARRVYLGDFPQTSAGANAARAEISGALDSGSLLTVFFGHGGRTEWAQENLWQLGDVTALQATGNYSFVLALNCVNAFFTNIDSEPHSLGEWWNLVADRGAVASWAPSALGSLFNYQVLADRLYEQIFTEKETTSGLAAWRALVDAYVMDNIDIVNLRDMIFFGDPAARLPLDSDRDGILERDELSAGSNPDDADTDDDGLTDDLEPAWDSDSDSDGLPNVADADADDDGLPDGLESGVTMPAASTDITAGRFIADSDPGSLTSSLNPDSDGGGAPDGAEDRNRNGAVDLGETDPQDPTDDPLCAATTPGEVTGLTLTKDAGDVVLSWTDQLTSDPCLLYPVYSANAAEFVRTGVATTAEWRVSGMPGEDSFFLIRASSPTHGDGPLGHYGE